MADGRCAVAGVVGGMNVPISEFWSGRRVLITGHTGFKGAWLAFWLEQLGAVVSGIALPASDPESAYQVLRPRLESDVHIDIRDRASFTRAVTATRPEVVFHLAAQALVPASYRDPVGTYETNVLGTVNVLSAAVDAGARAVVVVTSDKVYANDGSGRAYKEEDALGGVDPYSASKACADLATQSWRALVADSLTRIAIARAGNVMGGGDTSADRLLPDVHRALGAGEPVVLRRPDAVRPWQFVVEPLRGYLLLAQQILTEQQAPAAVNFGPSIASCRPVKDVVGHILELWGSGRWIAARGEAFPEAALLRLDSSLAERCLGWTPHLELTEAITFTVDWWRAARTGADLRQLAISQIDSGQHRP